MKNAIFYKLLFGHFIVIFVISTLMFIFTLSAVKEHYQKTFPETTKQTAVSLEYTIHNLIATKSGRALNEELRALGERVGARLTIAALDGSVIADSEYPLEQLDNHGDRPEIIAAFNGEEGETYRTSRTTGKNMYYVALPIMTNARPVAAFRAGMYTAKMSDLIRGISLRLWALVLIAAASAIVIAVFLARDISRPIRDLAKLSRKVASGDFNAQIQLRHNDEIQELANSFNYMVHHIKALFAELEGKREELTAIIESIREPLLVVAKDGKIKLHNKRLLDYTRGDSLVGRFYWDAIREPDFIRAIERANKEKRNVSEEAEAFGRVFVVNAAHTDRSGEETVVVLHDVTETKRLERLKKDFVANVSHELRTPLTAIKGYLETLEERLKGKPRAYARVALRNADRLINIVKDLLTLSQIENERFTLEYGDADLPKIVKNALRIFKGRAKKKGIRLRYRAPKPFPIIQADPFKIEQTAVNLIDNAIQYSEKGTVEAILSYTDTEASIEIKDSGVGIPEADIPRIFERFYVVDKSRSREGGGTGLGLSIVRHIALLHNGSIRVKTELGKGSSFTITIPRAR